MAIDTETKRRAAGCSPAASIFPVADATIGEFDRAAVAWVYKNIDTGLDLVKVIDEVMDIVELAPLVRRLRAAYVKKIIAFGY